jgi:hypothetical protein
MKNRIKSMMPNGITGLERVRSGYRPSFPVYAFVVRAGNTLWNFCGYIRCVESMFRRNTLPQNSKKKATKDARTPTISIWLCVTLENIKIYKRD